MSDRKGCAVGCGIFVVFLLIAAAVWWWQFTTFTPSSQPDPANSRWYIGYLHGMFILPNLAMSLIRDDNTSFYQAGAGGWYWIWLIMGASSGGSAGSTATSAGSRR